ncbi:MAG: hypothetical protein HOO94_08370 [Novosphingobium sp.]|nr:hypothetical protein [Novosphingobium sp.]
MAPAGTRTGRLATAGLVTAFAVYAALAAASALDRASEARPGLASRVPALLASEALRAGGRTALAAGDGRTALRLGEAAVADAPLDPASTALLGAARYATADRTGADRAFRIAAQLGWRVPHTQLYMMGRALEVGDLRVAALRLDALVRQNRALLRERALLDPLERDPRGRVALAERLRESPAWLTAYAMEVDDLPPDVIGQRAAVLGETARLGLAIGCQPIAPTVSALIRSNAVPAAAALWRAHCPGAAGSLIYDGNFANARIDQSRSEFAWSFIGQSEASVVFEPVSGGAGQALVIDSAPGRPRLVLRQLVLVPPGRYRLSWQATATQGQPSALVVVSFTCNPDPREWIEGQAAAGSARRTVEVTVDGACPARWLGLAIKGGSTAVRLADVRLEPIR